MMKKYLMAGTAGALLALSALQSQAEAKTRMLLVGSADYFGANYYRRDLIRFSPSAPGLIQILPGPGPRNDLGWEVYPEGLLRLLRQAFARYRLPIYVTENGIGTDDDAQRVRYVHDSLVAIAGTIADGIDVRGFFHWSLLDNFEWAFGYRMRFGIVGVDRATQARMLKPSAHWLAEVIRTNTLP